MEKLKLQDKKLKRKNKNFSASIDHDALRGERRWRTLCTCHRKPPPPPKGNIGH